MENSKHENKKDAFLYDQHVNSKLVIDSVMYAWGKKEATTQKQKAIALASYQDGHKAAQNDLKALLVFIQGKYNPSATPGIWGTVGRSGWVNTEGVIEHFTQYNHLSLDQYFETIYKRK